MGWMSAGCIGETEARHQTSCAALAGTLALFLERGARIKVVQRA